MKSRYCYDAAPDLYTGKERDSESNLDNFGARYDSSAMGRLMSPIRWADTRRTLRRSTDTNFYGAKSALEKAGFSVSCLDQCCNLYEMVHNWSLVNFPSPGDPNTGQNSVHFLVNPGDKVGLVVPTTGKLHGYETSPNVDPVGHLRKDMPW